MALMTLPLLATVQYCAGAVCGVLSLASLACLVPHSSLFANKRRGILTQASWFSSGLLL